MITRLFYPKEKKLYNQKIIHPVQTWQWGDFQQTQGHKVYRFGVFNKSILISAYSVSFHPIPHTTYSIGTILRGPRITSQMIAAIKKVAIQENAIFVKFEPDVIHQKFDQSNHATVVNPLPHFNNLVISPKVAFYPYSYIINLTHSQDQLLASMHPKTRYNIKVANRHAVKVQNQNTLLAFNTYLDLIFNTTRRQGFYLHSRQYHQVLWKTLKSTITAHLMLASYQNQVLSALMLFQTQDRLFYPYGGSLSTNRQVMAPTLLMWESIKFGQKQGCKTFDMWGCLGPDAKQGNPAFGFHRFKQGFGGQLVQFVGTYDLLINPQLYQIYNIVDKYRWKLLRLKAKLPFFK